jgi:Fic family protein
MAILETPQRIEPALLDQPSEAVNDIVAELSAASAILGQKLHPQTAANLASLVRLMNAYYSNLIEGHNTLPRDIERAQAGEFDDEDSRRNLQLEAAAHVRVQADIDLLALEDCLPEPASVTFIKRLHHQFYCDGPQDMLLIQSSHGQIIMDPGGFRSLPEHDNVVGRHHPPSSDTISAFMNYFESRYAFERMGKSSRIIAMATAHHRFNYIHPFPDGNGRVSRLMSHAMAHKAGIGAHGLWSISRGLARGLKSRRDYKSMMDLADTPRQGDLDGRGNLSQRALNEFVLWFLEIALDQVRFMTELFDLDTLSRRLKRLVDQHQDLKPESILLLEEALIRGSFERGEIARITRLSERTARRILSDLIGTGLLASQTPKGAVSLRFPVKFLDVLFPRLFPES